MSMSYQESQNYVWNINSGCLGEGTFGKVYCGTNKETGHQVAVKTFKHANQQVSKETKMLQTLNHQYIVQLIAIEAEKNSKSQVIIMELCNGGSLMHFLNEPENYLGLPDDEVLLVIEHLSRGLMYLKMHQVIHRDVKPDNIMRHVLDDGRTIYKLTDFGTARELPEGENFTSLLGTEAYLHPQMYKACFFQGPNHKREFGAYTDLWSIGVTLFQIATGYLPFRVPDRRAMLTIYNKITTTDGIISAHEEMDRVKFQKSLPVTCRLSSGLKQLITPIIARLFVHDDDERRWSFDKYHDAVVELVSRRVVDLFYVNKMQMLKVYVKPNESFADFQNYVCQQTNVDKDNQNFLYRQDVVNDFPVGGSDFIFLFDKSGALEPNNNVNGPIYEYLAHFKTQFMDSIVDDLRIPYQAFKDLLLCKHFMEYQSTAYQFFNSFVENFNGYCKNESKQLRNTYNYLLEKYANNAETVKILEKLQSDSSSSKNFEKTTEALVNEAAKLFDSATTNIEDNSRAPRISYLKIVSKRLTDMKKLNRNLITARNTNNKYYSLEKIKIAHCVSSILTIMTDKMNPEFEVFVAAAKHWYDQVFMARLHSLRSLKEQLHAYRCGLKEFEDGIKAELNKKLALVRSDKNLSRRKLCEILTQYRNNCGDFSSVVAENAEIVEKIGSVLEAGVGDCPLFSEVTALACAVNQAVR